MEEFPAMVRRWKDVAVGDLVLVGHPLELLLVTRITLCQGALGHEKRYVNVTSPNGKPREYLHYIEEEYLCYDEDWTTVLVKEDT